MNPTAPCPHLRAISDYFAQQFCAHPKGIAQQTDSNYQACTVEDYLQRCPLRTLM